MRLQVVRSGGSFVAAALLDDDGLVPEVVSERGEHEFEIVELRHSELVDDLDGAIKRLGGKPRK